ncbi:hypothetical protein ABIA33_006434 [Streptacidiphilus sp. MAP12-16]|uniref:hypothetical protein n=1 Tax=Streptacidiphilus sp. MAP12-16 TaxID=3156300 RepID=UPI0035181BB7
MSHPSVQLAGPLQDLGNHFISMLTGWAAPCLLVVGAIIVIVTMIRRFSLKAGIGALLALIVCLGMYQSRDRLATMFSNEVNSVPGGAAYLPGPVVAPLPPNVQ